MTDALAEYRDKRSAARYPMCLPLRWKLAGDRFPKIHAARSLNLSTHGIFVLETEDLPPVGAKLEIVADWPTPLNGETPLALHMLGYVVRVQDGFAVDLVREFAFKTAGRA